MTQNVKPCLIILTNGFINLHFVIMSQANDESEAIFLIQNGQKAIQNTEKELNTLINERELKREN